MSSNTFFAGASARAAAAEPPAFSEHHALRGLGDEIGLGLEVGQQAHERVDHGRIQRLPRLVLHDLQRLLGRHRLVERPLRGQRVEVVHGRENARAERNLLARQAVRIALAVPALVVIQDERRHRIGERHVRDDLRADLRMHLHPLELFLRQRTRLRQDVLGHRELSDVVQQRGRPHALHVAGRHAHGLGEPGREDLHAADVRRRGLVLGVDRQRERLDRREMQIRHLADPALLGIHAIEVQAVGAVNQVERHDQQPDRPGIAVRQQRHAGRRRAGADDEAQRAPDDVIVPDLAKRLAALEADGRRDQQRVEHEIAQRRRHRRRLEAAARRRLHPERPAEQHVNVARGECRDDQRRHAEHRAVQRIASLAAGRALHPGARRRDHHRRVRPEQQQRRELERERQRHRRAVVRERQVDLEHGGDRPPA